MCDGLKNGPDSFVRMLGVGIYLLERQWAREPRAGGARAAVETNRTIRYVYRIAL